MTSPATAAQFPRPDILRALVESYYGAGRVDPAASSHWRRYAARFSAEIDSSGVPIDLRGEGFGDNRYSSLAHRVSDLASIAAHVAGLPSRAALWRSMRRLRAIAARADFDVTFDAFRQAATLAFIDEHLGARDRALRVLIIGDGHGILGALVRECWPSARVTEVDLGRTLLFQAVTCQRAFPDARHALIGLDTDALAADFRYCPADRVAALGTEAFDLAINVASMQEMSPESVADYFAFLRTHMAEGGLFYCCNREAKTLPGGEQSIFARYPWSSRDRVLVDGPCPWHQYFLAMKPPFVRHYDGPHVHRLVVLEQENR